MLFRSVLRGKVSSFRFQGWAVHSACRRRRKRRWPSPGGTSRSSGSNNYAPSNPALAERVEADIAAFLEKNPGVSREDIPTDLMTASGSGLDPHISPASADVQVPRIVEASGLSDEQVRQIIADNTQDKTLGVFGEETVNVLGVNLDIALAMGLVSEVNH